MRGALDVRDAGIAGPEAETETVALFDDPFLLAVPKAIRGRKGRARVGRDIDLAD